MLVLMRSVKVEADLKGEVQVGKPGTMTDLWFNWEYIKLLERTLP